jgi:hypothetical protein
MVTSRTPKISKLCLMEDELKGNKFSFGRKSKFPTDVELKFRKQI